MNEFTLTLTEREIALIVDSLDYIPSPAIVTGKIKSKIFAQVNAAIEAQQKSEVHPDDKTPQPA